MEILFSESEIARRVAEMGREITDFYRGKSLTVVVIGNGALIFGADLVRRIDLPIWWDILPAGSYSGHQSTGEVVFRSPLKLPVNDRHILLVDEVLDTGLTMKRASDALLEQGALSVRTAVIVSKNHDRTSGGGLEKCDWSGFEAGDRYLIGYGLDSNEEYRNLPYLAALD